MFLALGLAHGMEGVRGSIPLSSTKYQVNRHIKAPKHQSNRSVVIADPFHGGVGCGCFRGGPQPILTIEDDVSTHEAGE